MIDTRLKPLADATALMALALPIRLACV